jgi:hypothetical protein
MRGVGHNYNLLFCFCCYCSINDNRADGEAKNKGIRGPEKEREKQHNYI